MVVTVCCSVRPWLFQEGAGNSQGSKLMRPEKYSYVENRCSIPHKVHDSLSIFTDLIVGGDNGSVVRIIFHQLSYIIFDKIETVVTGSFLVFKKFVKEIARFMFACVVKLVHYQCTKTIEYLM